MKYVPKDPGPEADNSSGGGLEGFLRETALMLAAHWVLGLTIVLLLLVVLGIIVAVSLLMA